MWHHKKHKESFIVKDINIYAVIFDAGHVNTSIEVMALQVVWLIIISMCHKQQGFLYICNKLFVIKLDCVHAINKAKRVLYIYI